MKLSRRWKLWLNGLGLGAAIIGFYLGQASSYGWVGRLVASTDVQAKQALEALSPGGALVEGAPSFGSLTVAISEVVAAKARAQVRPEDIVRIQRGVPTAHFGMGGLQQQLPLLIFLRGAAHPRVLDYAALLQALQDSIARRALVWSSCVFWLGILLTAATSYVPEAEGSAPEPAAAQQ